MIVYGIKNCDTVKKALTWIKGKNRSFDFHDYKSQGITAEKLKDWCSQVSWEVLLNKKGTTWRQLDEARKQMVTTEATAIALMMEKPSIIKRPVVEINGKIVVVGFDEKLYEQKV